ncbi:MAG: ATP-grasp domain-containing protein [Candidatus Micrarchaeia archaeon]
MGDFIQIFEDYANKLLEDNGIKVPKYKIVNSVEEAGNIYYSIGSEVIVKPIGIKGRGKLGLVYTARSNDEVISAVKQLLNRKVDNNTIVAAIVEEKLDTKKEFYLAVAVDTSLSKPVIIISSNGGIDIEEVSMKNPESIVRIPVNIIEGIDRKEIARSLLRIGINSDELFLDTISNVYSIFRKYDAELVEINPLILTNDDRLVAADIIININDDSLPRQKEILEYFKQHDKRSNIEKEMASMGWSYVELNGDIGIISSGAGLCMSTLDLMKMYGGNPANFLDMAQVDGDGLYKALDMMSKNSNVKTIFIHLVAGLNDCGLMAEGIKRFIEERNPNIKIVTRIVGNNEETGDKVLKSININNIHSMDEAVKKVVEVSRNGNIN